METIIQQVTAKMIEGIYKKVNENSLANIDQLATDLLKLSKETICELIPALVMHLNEQVRKDKAFRKVQGLTLKERGRSRTISTEAGEISYCRDYYQEKKSGKYIYPIDKIVGVEAYERVGPNVSALMVGQAADVSYEKSAAIVTGGKISRQTVKNKVLSAGKLEVEVPRAKRFVEELHIFADEDHVHMQERKNKMIPLITVCEGAYALSERRNALVNHVHFTGEILKTKELWEDVAGYISQAYDENRIERIYLHGDGAAWIKQGIEELPKCSFVIDGFHFEKHLKSVTAWFRDQNYSQQIRHAISKNDKLKALKCVNDMISSSSDSKQIKRIRMFKSYLKNNWGGIELRYNGSIMGSCTEALISHVLSERLSRNPMGWSDRGVHQMAQLRVYTRNGGKVTGDTIRRPREVKEYSFLREYGRERITAAISGCNDWSIFEKAGYVPSINTATQKLIRAYGTQRSFLG